MHRFPNWCTTDAELLDVTENRQSVNMVVHTHGGCVTYTGCEMKSAQCVLKVFLVSACWFIPQTSTMTKKTGIRINSLCCDWYWHWCSHFERKRQSCLDRRGLIWVWAYASKKGCLFVNIPTANSSWGFINVHIPQLASAVNILHFDNCVETFEERRWNA